MSDATKAVFLSYASQDAEAVERIAAALRTSGVEVWFDKNELVGGDAWDAKIRGQISSCALFVPVISAATQARREGYFRIEWRLAAQRTHAMADGTPFLVPVVIDETRDSEALVPVEFKAVQWTRLPGGAAPLPFCARVKKLLGVPGAMTEPGTSIPAPHKPPEQQATTRKPSRPLLLPVALGAAVLIAVALWQPWKKAAPTVESAPKTVPSVTTATAKPSSETQQLVAKVWALLNKPGMSRAELDAADALCKHATSLDPTDADAWAAWARTDTLFIYHSLDASPTRREAAREHAARAMQLAPTSFEARFAQAAYWANGLPALLRKPAEADAVRLLQELLRERPDEPRSQFLLARFLPETERAVMFEKVARNPGFTALALNDLAWNLAADGKFRESEAVLERSLAAHAYWDNLGLKVALAYYWHGDLALAKATLEKFSAADAQEDWGVFLAVRVSSLRGEFSEGLAVLDRTPRDWLATNVFEGPKALLSATLRRLGGQSELARRDYQRALSLLESRLATDPNNIDLLKEKTEALYYLGERADAEKFYRLIKESGQKPPAGLQALFEPDAAISYLETIRGIYSGAASLRLFPEYEPLRNQPRFIALLARAEADPARSPKAQVQPKLDDHAVAVLPFANLSGDKEQEYFSDGLTEEILNALARERDLRVPGRTSSFSFKGKNASAAEIASALNVSRLVEGSVQRSGSKVRIRVSLTRVADNASEELGTFTEELADIFALQDMVARAVVEKLTHRNVARGVDVLTKNPAAYDAYLKGRARQTVNITAAYESAAFYEQAVALDPSFGLAWARLAEARFRRFISQSDRSPEVVGATRVAIDRALSVQPNLPEALIARANWVRGVKYDFSAAQRDLERAEALQPATAELRMAQYALARDQGNWSDALRFAKECWQLDPQNSDYTVSAAGGFYARGDFMEADRLYAGNGLSYRAIMRLQWRGPEVALRLLDRASAEQMQRLEFFRAELLLMLGRKNEARAFLEGVVAPTAVMGFGATTNDAGRILLALGLDERARAWAMAAREEALKQFARGNRSPFARRNFVGAEIVLGHRDSALAALNEWRTEMLAVPSVSRRMSEFNSPAARLYARLGMADETIALLRELAANGSLKDGFELRYNSDYALIRNDPRFQELMQQAEAWAKAQPDPVDP